jgi:hypothetical protein
MQRVALALVLIATLAQCKTVDIKWKDCSDSSYHGKVKDIKITPNPPVLGKPISVEATGSLDEDISGGQYELKIKKIITVLDHKDNICGNSTIKLPLGMGTITVVGLTCPQKAGTVNLGQEMTISANAPSGAIEVDLTSKDSKGGNLVCVAVTATVSSDNEVAPLQENETAQVSSPYCLHHEDVASNKCYQACQADGKTFKSKGITSSGKCPLKYSALDDTHTAEQCPDGVTNLKYCQATKVKVSFATMGLSYCLHDEDVGGHKCTQACQADGKKFKSKGITTPSFCPSKYDVLDSTTTVEQCPDGVTNVKYCKGSVLKVKFETLGQGAALLAQQVASPYCLHQEDVEDHKCFEACQADGKTFKSKGITSSGKCPSKYSTLDKTVTETQCPDGVTNLRYCQATKVEVTIATKGLSGITQP